jgi:transcriptional regulator with XRE-family HTH domain
VFDIGASLAAAREARGLSLADVARLTCIRPRYLTALEHERFESLPGRTYGRAFLRSYANALGLDADRFVRAFEARVPDPQEELAPPPPSPRPLPSPRLTAVLAAVVVAGAFVAWSASTSSPTRVLAPTPPPAAASPKPTTVVPKASVLGAHHAIATVAHGLVVRARRGPCWLLARSGSPTGPVLFEGTLRRGATMRLAAPRVWLRLGAPGMVDVTRNGTSIGRLSGVSPLNIVV